MLKNDNRTDCSNTQIYRTPYFYIISLDLWRILTGTSCMKAAAASSEDALCLCKRPIFSPSPPPPLRLLPPLQPVPPRCLGDDHLHLFFSKNKLKCLTVYAQVETFQGFFFYHDLSPQRKWCKNSKDFQNKWCLLFIFVCKHINWQLMDINEQILL